MNSYLIVLLFVGFLALVLVFGYIGYQQQQQRLADMAALARRLGWQFVPERDSEHDGLYSQFEVFRRGHSRYAYNTLHGTLAINGEACHARMGDYHYKVTSGSGKSRSTSTYCFSYLIVHLPYSQLPTLFIRRENLFDSVAGAFGFDDIDFESAEFSKRYHVKSDDKRFAYDVIYPKMIEYLLNSEPPIVDIEAGKCCLTDGRRVWEVDEFRRHMDWTERFFALWPKHLVSTLKSLQG